MIGIAHPRPSIELGPDQRFEGRILRLTAVSSIALGLVWGLAVATLDVPPVVTGALLAGWLLMPAILAASLARPRLRYGLVVPATLVTVALLAVVIGRLPDDVVPAIGWISMTAGVALGGTLGLWFWFRLAPVPRSLDDPFSRRRWVLVGVHVALLVVGFVLASTALV